MEDFFVVGEVFYKGEIFIIRRGPNAEYRVYEMALPGDSTSASCVAMWNTLDEAKAYVEKKRVEYELDSTA